jgi:hypothetical protein
MEAGIVTSYVPISEIGSITVMVIVSRAPSRMKSPSGVAESCNGAACGGAKDTGCATLEIERA